MKQWLLYKPKLITLSIILRIDIERQFCEKGFVRFIPDLSIYNDGGLVGFIEMVNKNEVSVEKLNIIKEYVKNHNWNNLALIEIDCKWVLSQIKCPDKLKIIRAISLKF